LSFSDGLQYWSSAAAAVPFHSIHADHDHDHDLELIFITSKHGMRWCPYNSIIIKSDDDKYQMGVGETACASAHLSLNVMFQHSFGIVVTSLDAAALSPPFGMVVLVYHGRIHLMSMTVTCSSNALELLLDGQLQLGRHEPELGVTSVSEGRGGRAGQTERHTHSSTQLAKETSVSDRTWCERVEKGE